MEIKKINSDNRGEIYNYQIGDRTHVIVTFKEGVHRGGHYHDTAQCHIVLAGKFKVLFCDMDTKEEWEEDMIEGDSTMIPARVAHLFKAKEDGVLAESRIGDYEATDYEPYRKLARPK